MAITPVVPRTAALDRRFEGIVLLGEPVVEAVPAGTVGRLRREGIGVAVVAGLPVAELARRVSGREPALGVLLLADARGLDAAVVEPDAPLRGLTRHTAVDVAALDEVARAVASRLTALGLAASVVRRPAGSVVAAVDLALDGAAGGDADTLPAALLAAGLSGSGALVELAASVAREAGLGDARVAWTGSAVEIGFGDVGDAVAWACAELWRTGVGRRNVLVVAGGLGRTRDDLDPLLEPDLDGVTVVAVDVPEAVVPPGVVTLPGGVDGVADLLDDQVRRRDEGAVPAAVPEPGWGLVRDGFDAERERVDEASLALADGCIGTSGAPLTGHPAVRPWVLAGGVYVGDGPETRLLTAPVAFRLPGALTQQDRLGRVLDLRSGVLFEEVGGGGRSVRSARFSSLARPGTVALRARESGTMGPSEPLAPPSDDPAFDAGYDGGVGWMRVAGTTGGVAAAAADRRLSVAGEGDTLDRFAVYHADPAVLPPGRAAVEQVRAVADAGFDRLLAEQRRAWAARWEDADVAIEGDEDLQQAIRFSLFHLMASPPGCGEAAVGARGLSGTSYRGHVFWDADTFVLPFFAATHPAAARAMLEYRLRRLPAALEAARAMGRAGARFPWESAATGRDVTPVSARDRTGRLVPIRTGQLEEHIVAEVAWAARCYADWSGDEEFVRGPGLRLLVETARYWASRIRVEGDGSGHIYGVIGPDEYHEPVDDNAFTNVMARWNLRQAAAAAEAVGPGPATPDPAEVARWRALAAAIVDAWDPDTGVYEQFAGFGRLEPLIIAEVAPRRPIAADLLLGAARVHGAQVLKQADVLMLHHLVPDEVEPGTLDANLRYYEPRTAHGSSLSPSIHASLFARARDFEHAMQALRIASRIDLDDLTGSTAGGLHLATMGGLWQAFAFGFFGLRPRDGRLHVDPRLPPAWSALEIRVRFHGARVRVRTEHDALTIAADAPTAIAVDGVSHTAGPGELVFHRKGRSWEVTP